MRGPFRLQKSEWTFLGLQCGASTLEAASWVTTSQAEMEGSRPENASTVDNKVRLDLQHERGRPAISKGILRIPRVEKDIYVYS